VNRLGAPGHLARRFLQSVRGGWPTPDDQTWVATLLDADESELFWSQSAIDACHGIAVARYVGETLPARPDLLRAALFHDIGKTVNPIGPIRRSIATVLAALGLPLSRRMATYRQHAERGAEILSDHGHTGITVDFARHHKSAEPPAGVEPSVWDVLRRADHLA